MNVERAGGLPAKHSISLREALVSADTEPKLSPIGGIIYGGGSRVVLVEEDPLGRVAVRRLADFLEPVTARKFIEVSDRVLDMSSFVDVAILQAGVEGVAVQAHSSIRTFPSVTVTIEAENPETGEAGPHLIEEDPLLRLFTGQKGGIAVFSGNGSPESNALVLEGNTDPDERTATVLFIKPSGADGVVVDSVLGFQQLVEGLASEFVDNAPLYLQTQAVNALDVAIRDGRIDFHGSAARAAIYRMYVIALARLAERTRERHYADALEKRLPGLRPGLMRRFRAARTINPAGVDRVIEGLIKHDFATKPEVKPKGPKLSPRDTEIYESFQSRWAKSMWKDVAEDRDYRTNNIISRIFLQNLIPTVYSAKSLQDFTDVRGLIDAFFASEYGQLVLHCTLRLDGAKGNIKFDDSKEGIPASKIREELLQKVDELERFSLPPQPQQDS